MAQHRQAKTSPSNSKVLPGNEIKLPLKNKSSADFYSLPAYGSAAQCSSMTGIPVTLLRQAKKDGCPAFKHSRIELGPFLRWYFNKDIDDADWGTELKQAQAKRENIKLAEDERRVIDRTEVSFALNKGMALLFQRMDRSFSVELPSVLKGLEEGAIQARLLGAVGGFKTALKGELSALAKNGDA